MNCPPAGNYLPITTGRIGLSQGTGGLEFYGQNYRGTGIALFHGFWSNCPPASLPWAGRPPFQCQPWAGGCSCGCNPCCCDNTKCFTFLLTNISPWCCYWTDQQYAAWLTGKQPWPTSASGAKSILQQMLPAACLPPVPTPVAA